MTNKFVDGSFESEYKETIGATYKSRTVRIDGRYNVDIELWDIAG